ncbi:MAG: WhiB family transcriptional regulator, partial [Pseudonocardiaceae bacterium]
MCDERIASDVDRETSWRNKAACLGQDPERFFPLGVTGLASDQIRQAKAVCAGCEVRAACLRWALETNQDAGIWGGLSEDERREERREERRALRRSRRRQANGSVAQIWS